jgi:pimeloyl-ACP methyl ester carboxylesterase
MRIPLLGDSGPTPHWAPEPPADLPPGRIVHVPGRGEFFLRDSGGDGTPVLLLHGWMFSADLNWWRAYKPLQQAGYRVLAIDHRGHGRGLRTHAPFRLTDCAADAAALLDHIGATPALVVGYSMGGPIAQYMARDHGHTVAGLVLCATSTEWQDPRQKALWQGLALIRLALGLSPIALWRRMLRLAGFPDSPVTTWTTAELSRGSSVDIAEAGRELSRFDSRSWVGDLVPPAAVVVTTRDQGVPPDRQRRLAQRLDAPTFEVDGDHGACVAKAREFNRALLDALEAVATGTPAALGEAATA